MDDYIIDDEDLQHGNPAWNPSEWIACGRDYKDLPAYVAVEAERTLHLP